MEPIKMTVLIDEDSNECLYVEDAAWHSRGEITVFVCDLVAEAKGRPMLLDHVRVSRPGRDVEDKGWVYDRWPRSLADTLAWRETAATVS